MHSKGEFDTITESLKQLAEMNALTSNVKEVPYEEPDLEPQVQMRYDDSADYEFVDEPSDDYTSPTSHDHFYEQTLPIDGYDERIWANGPLKSEVESWKKQYTHIYLADDIDPDQIFVYRTVNRYEYKAIMASPNTDPLMREEMFCEQCVLFPYEYSYGLMANGNAGNVSALADLILFSSGFGKNTTPRRL